MGACIEKETCMYPVSLRNVDKTYRLDTVTVPALSGVSIDIRPGRFTVLCGPSGSGKTTLLNMMGCIDRPDAGEIQVDGQAVQAMTADPEFQAIVRKGGGTPSQVGGDEFAKIVQRDSKLWGDLIKRLNITPT